MLHALLTRTAVLAVMLVAVLASLAGPAAAAPGTPCQDQARGLRILCNLPAIVVVTADAISPHGAH
jgi:hypothetical protein